MMVDLVRLTYFQARSLYALNRRGALLGDDVVMCARLVEDGAFFHTYCRTPLEVVGMRRLRSTNFVDVNDWPTTDLSGLNPIWPWPREDGVLRAWNCAEVRDLMERELEKRAKQCNNKELRAPDSQEMAVDADALQSEIWRGELPPLDGFTIEASIPSSLIIEVYDQMQAEVKLSDDPTLVGFSREQLIRPYITVEPGDNSEVSENGSASKTVDFDVVSPNGYTIPGRVILVVGCFYLLGGESEVTLQTNGDWIALATERGAAFWRDEDVSDRMPDCLMW